MVLFTPPTTTVGTVRPWQSAGQRAIARISGPMPVGQTLYKKNGTWRLELSPSATAVDGAEPVYVGGHWYEVATDAYAELVALGYAPTIVGLYPSSTTYPGASTYPGANT